MCLSMCIYLCIGINCVFLWTERDKERIRQTEGGRDSQRTGLRGHGACRCIIWDCHACRPLTCVGSLIGLYWFHTASEVSISWSQMNSVFTSCRTGSFCTQRDLNVCSLTYEAEGKRAVKVLIRLWRAEVVLLFFQIKGI